MKKESSKKDAILKMQFSMAMNGSVEMLKWLGINICGQDGKPDLSNTEELPNGFSVTRVPNAYEQEVVQEYEDNKEEFLEWKKSRDA